MNAHVTFFEKPEPFRHFPNSLSPFIALLTLLAIFVSLVPCETTQVAGGQTDLVVAHSEAPASSSDSTPACADNCPCLCAGSCSAALPSNAVGMVVAEHPNELNVNADTLIARLIPERHFRPPRLVSVV